MLYYEIIENKPNEQIAFVFRNQEYTYGQVESLVNNWAAALQRQGVQPGERVGLLSKNSPYFVIAYLAIIKAGGVVVPFNFQLAAMEIAYIISDANIKHMVVNQPLELETALAEYHAPAVNQITFAQLLAMDEGMIPETVGMDEKDNCTIIYTSGTTGKPKGAMLSHKNLISNTEDFTQVISIATTDKMICVLPMYHCFAWTVSVSGPLYHGGTIVIQENYVFKDCVKLIQDNGVTVFAGVPTMIQLFLKGAQPEELATIHTFISGGAALPKTIAEGFRDTFGMYVQEGYGLSEASPVVTVNPAQLVKIGSIGPALPNVQTKIIDTQGESLGANQVGELCVQGNNVMLGYLHNPEATAMALQGEWLHTGDLATMDEDGYIYIVDRLKDMIISSGENVYPREVEEAIHTHGGVAEVAVIGAPDKIRGQAICAYVVLQEGVTLDKKALRKYLLERIATYKVPKKVFFLDALPKNSTGKIMKRLLQERVIEDIENKLK